MLKQTHLNNVFKNDVPFENLKTTRLVLFEKYNKVFIEEKEEVQPYQCGCCNSFIKFKMTIQFENALLSLTRRVLFETKNISQLER